ncbi:hypothetical protein FHS43_000734 [Streptosporangium becharense]|uniref:Uncharacterized protein n=1 Tax=Streptosporangium becharense TaxID=1816182 RepID=A0A7W9IF30_9ACTN|nr:hypothetical protein [Streptosporangium becharense]MBB5819555.1 hypothetical protein [Streptosporangium becharense]
MDLSGPTPLRPDDPAASGRTRDLLVRAGVRRPAAPRAL